MNCVRGARTDIHGISGTITRAHAQGVKCMSVVILIYQYHPIDDKDLGAVSHLSIIPPPVEGTLQILANRSYRDVKRCVIFYLYTYPDQAYRM